MKRDDWVFDYTAAKLAEAAVAKKATHEKKKEWWESKKSEVMTKVRESGIEVRDSVASSYSNTKGNFGPQIEVDAGMQRDLTECQQKILEHDRLVRDYDGWVQALTANPEARLSLDHDDYLFFFGA
jgi:putative NADPH-quinone reductase